MSTTSLPLNVDALCQQFEKLKDAERERHELMETLLRQVKELSQEQEETRKALRATEILANDYQKRFEAADTDLNKLRKTLESDSFVLVLINGDRTLFHDRYVKDGLQGGERAAKDFQQALSDYFKDKQYFKHNHKIVTKIYQNSWSLSRKYSGAKIVSDPISFQQFIQGFNKEYYLMEIIDAGDVHNAAYCKLKAEFNLFQRNLHCKQIILASPEDTQYSDLLRPYAPGTGKSNEITLIKALSFAWSFAGFDKIFRDTELSTKSVEPRMVYVNDRGQRLDQPIQNLDEDLVRKLEGAAVCKKKLLNNSCTGCWLRHDVVLNAIELEHLRYVARFTPCKVGLTCRDPDCIDGHQCRYGTECEQWRTRYCKHCGTSWTSRDPDCVDNHQCGHGIKRERDIFGCCALSDAWHRVDTSNSTAVPAAVSGLSAL